MTDTGSKEGSSPSSSSVPDRIDSFAVVLGPLVVLTLAAVSWAAGHYSARSQDLEIVASALTDSTNAWQVTGRVLRRSDGTPVPAQVWVVVVDRNGNRQTPPAALAHASGEFTFPPIAKRWGADSVAASNVTIHATYQPTAPGDGQLLFGETAVRLSKEGRVQWIDPSAGALVTIGVLFILMILTGLFPLQPGSYGLKRTKYFALVGLSFVFACTMIYFIGSGLKSINTSAAAGDVISLGFANVYYGTYVKDLPQEWLFSLTSPDLSPASKSGANIGFGAPLWVLLVSVLGAGLFTFSLLVSHVRDPIPVADEPTYRTKIEELVRHQFYILFAPLGAVFVYQLLVVAGAASAQITVAITILAVGTATNLLLDNAVKKIQDMLK